MFGAVTAEGRAGAATLQVGRTNVCKGGASGEPDQCWLRA